MAGERTSYSELCLLPPPHHHHQQQQQQLQQESDQIPAAEPPSPLPLQVLETNTRHHWECQIPMSRIMPIQLLRLRLTSGSMHLRASTMYTATPTTITTTNHSSSSNNNNNRHHRVLFPPTPTSKSPVFVMSSNNPGTMYV